MPIPNPYVGPQPFSRTQQLSGRDREVVELRGLITSERIVLLYSPSGAGKSSLVHAGLIPQLMKRFDIWGPTRVNTEPPVPVNNRFVWSAIAGLAGTDQHDDVTLSEYVASRPRDKYPLIVIDQFEEILRIDPTNSAPKQEFFAQLGKVLSDPGIWALLILREDYLAPLDPFAMLIPTHLKNRYRIDRLTVKGAEDAIRNPTEKLARHFAPGVVETLARNLATVKVQNALGVVEEQVGDYVEPLQLQVVCFDLWERMERDHPNDLFIEEHDIGDVGGALKSYYNTAARIAASPLPKPAGPNSVRRYDESRERAIREWFQNKLITPEGVRDQVRHDPAGVSGGLANDVVQDLLDTYLVRGEPRGSSIWYELAHDRLVAPVRESNTAWLDAHLNKLQKSARLWIAEGRKPALLLLGDELSAALAEAEGLELQPNEDEFLKASKSAQADVDRQAAAELHEREQAQREKEQAQREREQAEKLRKRNIFLRIALGFAVLAVVAAGLLWNVARTSAEEARNSANAASVSAEAARDAKVAALRDKGIAEEAARVAGAAQLDATNKKQIADGALAKADAAILRLFTEKARDADARVMASDNVSPEDARDVWLYTLATLDHATAPVPDVAGVLLRVDELSVLPDDPEDDDTDPGEDNSVAGMTRATIMNDSGDLFYSRDNSSQQSRLHCSDCKLPAALQIPAGLVRSLATDATEKQFAVGLDRTVENPGGQQTEHSVFVYEGKGAMLQWTSPDSVRALAFGPEYLAAGTTDGRIILLVVGPGKLEKAIELPCRVSRDKCPAVQALAWSRERDPVLAAGMGDGSVSYYRVAHSGNQLISAGRPSATNSATAGVTSVAFWGNSGTVVTGHGDGTVRVLDRNSGKLLARTPLHESAVLALYFDKDYEELFSASDNDLQDLPLQNSVFNEEFDLKKILSEQGGELRHKMLHRSLEQLGYKNIGGGHELEEDDLTPTDSAMSAALKYFGSDVQIESFTKNDLAGNDLLKRQRTLPVAFPLLRGEEISLMPDRVQGARSSVMSKQDLKGAFKAEFEYQMQNTLGDSRLIGDGFAFMFYKDRTPYVNNTVPDTAFGFAWGNGYGLVFNAYTYRSPGIGLRVYSPATTTDDRPDMSVGDTRVFAPGKWIKACIDVLPVTGKPMCVPGGPDFQGMRVYLDGRLALSRPGPMNNSYGGFGFGAATGEAVLKQDIRNVRITPAGAASPDPALAFTLDGTLRAHRVATGNYPVYQDNKLILTHDQEYSQTTAVLMDTTPAQQKQKKGASPLPGITKDFAVDFEYSIKNAVSSDPNYTGYGLVFMFGKDKKPYETENLAAPLEKGFLPGSGFGVNFNTYGRRSITLCGKNGCGVDEKEALQVSQVRSMPDVYSNGQWRRVRVEVNRTIGTVRVIYEGSEVLNSHIDMNGMGSWIGFGASTGLVFGDHITAEHAVRHVVISSLSKKKQADAENAKPASTKKQKNK